MRTRVLLVVLVAAAAGWFVRNPSWVRPAALAVSALAAAALLWGRSAGSRKAADLHRDPRVLVHSVVTSPSGEEGEVKLRGTAVPHDDQATHEHYAEAVSAALPWSPEVGKFHLFAVDIEQATYIRYANSTGDQHVAIWPPAKEFWRRATSATSVGDEEPVRDLLQ
jgi:hypothetical protein